MDTVYNSPLLYIWNSPVHVCWGLASGLLELQIPNCILTAQTQRNPSLLEKYLETHLFCCVELTWLRTPSCSESGWLTGVAHAEPIVLPDFSTTQELEGMSLHSSSMTSSLSFCLDLPRFTQDLLKDNIFPSTHLALWSDLNPRFFHETGWNGLWHIPLEQGLFLWNSCFFLSSNFLFPLNSPILSFWTCQTHPFKMKLSEDSGLKSNFLCSMD